MIRSFACEDTETIFHGERSGRLPADIQKRALRKLLILDAATDVNDLRTPPGNHLEKLSRDRQGQWSIRVNDQWRICFEWRDTGAWNTKIVDYH